METATKNRFKSYFSSFENTWKYLNIFFEAWFQTLKIEFDLLVIYTRFKK